MEREQGAERFEGNFIDPHDDTHKLKTQAKSLDGRLLQARARSASPADHAVRRDRDAVPGRDVDRLSDQDSLVAAGMDPKAAAALADTREFPELREQLEQRRGAIQDSLWNAFAVDLAMVAADGTDPSGNDLRVDRYGVWVSLAAPVTRSGQLLLGLREGAERDSITADMRFTGRANARFYVGRNYAKILSRGASQAHERSPVLLLN